uniref:Uncharacterized protein n=1 Tax=Rhizophora mucronata TaxID=61149 RepID=A0A2P2PQ83_RHIMU
MAHCVSLIWFGYKTSTGSLRK